MPLWYLIPAAMMIGLWAWLNCAPGGIFHDRARQRRKLAEAEARAELQAEITEAIARAVTDEQGRAL